MFVHKTILLALPELARARRPMTVVNALARQLVDSRHRATLVYLRAIIPGGVHRLQDKIRRPVYRTARHWSTTRGIAAGMLDDRKLSVPSTHAQGGLRFHAAMRRMDAELRKFVHQLMPHDLAQQLLYRSVQKRTALAHALARAGHKGVVRRKRACRARYIAWRDLLLTWCTVCLYRVPTSTGLAVSYRRSRDVFDTLTKRFQTNWEPVELWSLHDLRDPLQPCMRWRAAPLTPAAGQQLRVTHMRRAHVPGPDGEPLIVYVQYRRKNLIDTIGKVLAPDARPPVHDIMDVPDFHGIRFLLEDDAAVERLLALPAMTRIREEAYDVKEASGQQQPNRRSRGFRGILIKCRPKRIWVGEEYQVMTMADFLTAEYSAGEIAHARYKLRAHLDTTLPWLFPPTLFGVDWSNEEVRVACEQHVLARAQR